MPEIHLHMETHHTNASQISKFALEKTTSPIISLDRSTDAFVQQNSKERSSSNPNLLRKTSSDFNTIAEERLMDVVKMFYTLDISQGHNF